MTTDEHRLSQAMGKLDGAIEGDGAFRLGSRSWAIANKGVQRLAKES